MIKMPIRKYAIIRGVPNTYDRCIKSHKVENEISVELAKEQHTRYCEILEQLGLTLIFIDPDDRFPDCCFIEDPAIVIGDTAIISRMAAKARVGEEIEVRNTLSQYKKVKEIKPPGTLDGGDVLRINEKIYVGVSERTNHFAIQQLRTYLSDYGYGVIPVKIVHILHLKSACTFIGNNYIVMFPGHFDDEIFSEYDRIIIQKGEAHSANCLSVNGKVLVQKGYPNTKKLIEDAGFETVDIEMSEFRKGGGSLTCLSIIF
ncbi:MAG: dimethylarginine dimethylaminohydrolase family protein [Thermodesulfobacteriota bacterium]